MNGTEISMFSETTVLVILEILRFTLLELQHTSIRFATDDRARSSLAILSLALGRIEQRLEFVVDNEDVAQRLCDISIGNQGHQYPVLHGLAADLKTICAYLCNVRLSGTILLQTDANIFATNLDRYCEILTAVWKRSKEYVLTLAYCSILTTLSENDKRLVECSTTRHLRT
jgi:hypothetical protein